jgi:hypothetical protein
MLTLVLALLFAPDLPLRVDVERFAASHIVQEEMLPAGERESICGPAMIRVPDWVEKPLGRYYLYFAHHNGRHIRLAYADDPEGPWRVHAPGVTPMASLPLLRGHVASPEAVVDEVNQRIVLFVHGRPTPGKGLGQAQGRDEGDGDGPQITVPAVSRDGLHFEMQPVVSGPAYLRLFRRDGRWFGVNGRGELFAGTDLLAPFTFVKPLIGRDIVDAVDPLLLGEPGAPTDRPAEGPDRYAVRHSGLDVVDGHLWVYFTCVGHRPERILVTAVALRGDPAEWRARGVAEVLRPEMEWEGARLPLGYSKGGRSRAWEHALRDPAVFRDGGRVWLLYSTAGEHGLGMARLRYSEQR